MRNTPLLFVMPKKYLFLMGAVLFLIGSVAGMSPTIEMLSTVFMTYAYSIVVYMCVRGLDERNFRFMLFTSTMIVLRSEEHTSELQSRPHLVCRLLLEK